MLGRIKEKWWQIRTLTPKWVWVAAIAAVLAIAVGVIAVLHAVRGSIPIEAAQNSSSAPLYYGDENTSYNASYEGEPVTAGITVTARLVEALPDTYTCYDDWDQAPFYLLRFEVIDVLSGEKVPDEFLFMMPAAYMTDYSLYDTLLFDDIAQYGMEYYLLYNKTQDRPQQLDTVLFGSITYSHSYLARFIEAFDSEGRFDMRLWRSTEEWKDRTGRTIEYYGAAYYETYTLQDAVEEHSPSGIGYKEKYVHSLGDVRGDGAEALAYVKNTENGIYVTVTDGFTLYKDPEIQLRLYRYINGMATNEKVMICEDTALWSKTRFSKEDEQRLPDLRGAMEAVSAAFDAGKINRPHMKWLSGEAKGTHGIFGWYVKTPQGVVGIVRVTWRDRDESLGVYADGFYYDDAYYIVEYGSENCVPIDRDELLDMLGEYETDYIFTGGYDQYGKKR